MVLSTEWSQVEVIDLRNDGSGLGFGIVGGRSTGVVVKSILPGGIADKDNRLQSGDHIIQIGDVNLRGFSAEQVASVLRSAGVEVRMVVARPIESTSEQFKNRTVETTKYSSDDEEFENRITSIVPTKILTDPEEIERLLISNGYQDYDNVVENEITEDSFIVNGSCDSLEDNTTSNFDYSTNLNNPSTAQFNTNLNKSCTEQDNTNVNNPSTAFEDTINTGLTTQFGIKISQTTGTQFNTSVTTNLNIDPTLTSNNTSPKVISTSNNTSSHNPNCTSLSLRFNPNRLSTFSDTDITSNLKLFDNTKKRHSDFNPESDTASSFKNTNPTPNFNPPAVSPCNIESASNVNLHKTSNFGPHIATTTSNFNPHVATSNFHTLRHSDFNPDAISCCTNIPTPTPTRPTRNFNNRYVSTNCKQTSPLSDEETSTFAVDIDIEYSLPETERFTLLLNKTEYGLGITIAGYVCEREDLSGIFVKSISEGSEAHKCGRINCNDRIVEVNGESLHDCTNYEAVEKLKKSGSEVRLTFERYLRGPKFEHLQEALAVTKEVQKDLSPPSPSVTTLSWIPIDTEPQIEPEGESCTTINSEIYYEPPETKEIFVEDNFRSEPSPDCESVIKRKWSTIIGEEAEIVVAHLTKLTGLGISLEGTVDVEAGIEVRPHHYIRSILPEGPVGQNGRLNSGDELLEVNGQKLLGIKHVEVVKILKDLPSTVRLVCARKNEENRVINTSQDREAFEARNIVGGSLKNLLNDTQQHQEKEKKLLKAFSDTFNSESGETQTQHRINHQQRLLKALSDTLDSQSEHQQNQQRLLKALSDTSINTSSTATITDENSLSNLNKAKSRSLENTNLAMWGDEVEYIDLMKTDRGLGFSILDYQDPVDVKSTVIVIRSLVPNGAAESDGRLRPGDRLISVNDKSVKNSTLDQAVQVLKGAQMGLVKLGVARPLPVVRGGSGGSGSSPTIGS